MGSSHILTEGKPTARHAGLTYRRGEILQRFEYAPFGQEIYVLNPNLHFDPSYTGQNLDIETGLYYYKSRYYNPVLARFTQPDTVVPSASNLQAYNRYSYVNNNPLKYVDPSGHFWFIPFLIAIAIGGAIGAVTSAIFGGNILLGALQGAIMAAAFFGAGSVIEGMKITSLLVKAGIHAAAGAAAGAVNNTVAGGDIGDVGRGALTGGLSGGLSKYAGKFLDNADFLMQLLGRSLVGAAAGAAAAAIYGSDVLKGLGYGAAYGGASYVFNEGFHRGAQYLKNQQEKRNLQALEIDQRFQKDPVANRYQEIKAPFKTALGIASTGAAVLGVVTQSPILGAAAIVGGVVLTIDHLRDVYSKLGQGDFAGANRIIGDIMTSTPGTGVNQP